MPYRQPPVGADSVLFDEGLVDPYRIHFRRRHGLSVCQQHAHVIGAFRINHVVDACNPLFHTTDREIRQVAYVDDLYDVIR